MIGASYTARETGYLYFHTYEDSLWGAFQSSRPDPTGYYPGPERRYPDFETYADLLAAAHRAVHPDPREFRTLVWHPHTDAYALNILWDHTGRQKPDHARWNRHAIVESAKTTELLLAKCWRTSEDAWIREKILLSPNCTERLLLVVAAAVDRVSLSKTRGWTMPELARMILERQPGRPDGGAPRNSFRVAHMKVNWDEQIAK